MTNREIKLPKLCDLKQVEVIPQVVTMILMMNLIVMRMKVAETDEVESHLIQSPRYMAGFQCRYHCLLLALCKQSQSILYCSSSHPGVLMLEIFFGVLWQSGEWM